MLQRNLFAIIFASLVLVFTTNAFGQWHPEIDRVKTTKKINKTKGFTEVSGLSIETQRRKRPRRKSAQYNPKEVGIDKIKGKKPTSFTSAEGRSMSFELRRRHPRKIKN